MSNQSAKKYRKTKRIPITKIGRLLMEREISQLEFGNMAGMALSSISEITSGKIVPNTPTVFKFCKILKVTPNDILDYEEKI